MTPNAYDNAAMTGKRIRFGGKTVTVDLPHLAFVTAIAGWCLWFCRDAWLAQHDVENLILIVPGSIVALILWAVIAAGCFQAGEGAQEQPGPAHHQAGGVKVAGTMALLAAFAVAGPRIGFDVVSFAYMLAMLLLLGERRPIILLIVPALFCAIVITCFATLLATPLPLLLFPGDGS